MKHTNSNRAIYSWLLSGIALVSLMVIVGGITRLTQSGLSMVEWKPVVGIIPPIGEMEWTLEFEKYKQTPEFRLINSDFTMDDFKRIFFWEYVHRLIARIMGLVFIVPLIWFFLKGVINKKLMTHLVVIILLGLLQGLMGWLMVKSGMVNMPHVSHYRLAMHLGLAIVLILYIYHTALCVKSGWRQKQKKMSLSLGFIGVLLLLQTAYGAFVAGLKAGKMYNHFPKMDSHWISEDVMYSFKIFGVKSFFESPSLVQFIHRITGLTLLITVCFLFFKSRKATSRLKSDATALSALIVVQVILGIATLLLSVPVWLGVLHQGFLVLIILQYYKTVFYARREH